MPIRFMYLHQVTPSVKWDDTACKYAVLETKVPIACVAIDVDEEEQEIYYAVSACDPRDVFDYKTARLKAEARLKSEKSFHVVDLDGAIRRYTITGLVAEDIVALSQEPVNSDPEVKHVPVFSRRVYKAAKHWLRSNPNWSAIDIEVDLDEIGLPERVQEVVQEMVAE